MKEGPMILHSLAPSVPVQVSYSWFAMAVLIGLAVAARMGLKKTAPTGVQNLMEVVVGGLEDFIEDIMGPEGKNYFTVIASLFLFILVCNLMGLVPGFDSPTANINTTLALALVSFSATHYIGLRRHGIGYVKHFMGPMWLLAPLMLPIELISHLARPMSLAVRLMGNMMADHKVVMSFFALVPILVPLPFLLLGLLVCLVQALVFCTLTMVYIGSAIEHEEH